MVVDRTLLLDVDGTLVDTNYHHALAWYRAFKEHGLVLPLWRLHRHMGMGGDQLVEAVAGEHAEKTMGDAIRATEAHCYSELIGEVSLLAGAHDLLAALRETGWATVLASSCKQPELDHYLDLLDARNLVNAWTSARDVRATKPAPELIEAALAKVGAGSGLLVGDSIFDCHAAARAGIGSVAVLTGGFSREELTDAGASRVFGSLGELRAWLEDPAAG